MCTCQFIMRLTVLNINKAQQFKHNKRKIRLTKIELISKHHYIKNASQNSDMISRYLDQVLLSKQSRQMIIFEVFKTR